MKLIRRNALIVGPYRAHNFGDDLVGGILARHLRGRGYKVTVPRLGRANSEWLGTRFAENYAGAFEAADTVVVGGGGIMSDTSGANPGASYLGIVADAGMKGLLKRRRVYVTSVGAGPWILDRSRMLAFGISLVADKVGVRELESYNHLRGLGVSEQKLVLGADLALLTPEMLSYEPLPSGKLGLQFDVNAFKDASSNPHLEKIVEAISDYASANANDVALLRNGRSKSEIADAAPSAETMSYTSLEQFLPRIAGLRGLFTSHLHLAITSYAQRIPTFSLYVREKTRRFYEQIGRPERAIDLRTATVDDALRFIDAAGNAKWTPEDEMTLTRLKSEARLLVDFIV